MRAYFGIFVFLFLLLAVACEKDIEIELNSQEDQMVMYAFIYPDSALNLHFSKSQSILALPNYKQIENGRFRISINDNNQGTYILPSDTVWSSWKEFVFKPGDKVKIEAYERDGDTVKVESFLPMVVDIESMDTTRINTPIDDGGNEAFLKTRLSFTDPADEDNYYQLYVVREGWGTIGGDPYYTYAVVEFMKDDPIFLQRDQGGSLLQGLDFQGLFTDQLINGHSYELTYNLPVDYMFFDYYEDKIKITTYLYHHTSDYYSYFRTKILSAGYEGFYEGLPIFDPVRVHNNVQGGLGLVSGLTFDSDSIVLYK